MDLSWPFSTIGFIAHERTMQPTRRRKVFGKECFENVIKKKNSKAMVEALSDDELDEDYIRQLESALQRGEVPIIYWSGRPEPVATISKHLLQLPLAGALQIAKKPSDPYEFDEGEEENATTAVGGNSKWKHTTSATSVHNLTNGDSDQALVDIPTATSKDTFSLFPASVDEVR